MKKFFNREFVTVHKDRILKAAVAIVICVVALVVFIRKDKNAETSLENGGEVTASEKAAGSENGNGKSSSENSSADRLIIDVSGAVKSPAVIELKQGDRVQDAIEAAGGLKKNADISNINRAAHVKDGDKINIPEKNKGSGAYAGVISAGNAANDLKSDSLVNINTATEAELQTLTGVGPAIASKIINYREQSGGFHTKEDIKKVSGIGDKTYEKLKDNITV